MLKLKYAAILIPILAILIVLATRIPHQSHAEPPVNVLYTPQALVTILNKERAYNGLKTVEILPELNKVSKIKLDDMIEKVYHSHIMPEYGKVVSPEMEAILKKTCVESSENLAWENDNPITGGWTMSKKHREAQLNEKYDAVGFASGIGKDNLNYYVASFCKMR